MEMGSNCPEVNWSYIVQYTRRPALGRATITMRKRKREGFPGCQSFSQEDFTSIGCCCCAAWCSTLE